MDLEFLLRQKPKWRVALQDILFKEGDIVEHGEEAEEDEQKGGLRVSHAFPTPPQGDRKGPHSAPRNPRPYKDTEQPIPFS